MRSLLAVRSVAVAAALACAAPVPAVRAAEAEAAPGTYRIVDGKVDAGTFRGWLTYHIACQTCHGRDAVSVGVAPDLLRSLSFMPEPEFTRNVLARYRVSLGLADLLTSDGRRQSVLDELMRQQMGEHPGTAMPAWQADPAISGRVRDLHAYLKARADGALPPGRPNMAEPSAAPR